MYLSVDHPEDVERRSATPASGPDDVDLLVATDSEGILGIGDQGVGGIEIAVGKLAVYTAAAGIHPRRVLPVVLDMGTDNLKLLNDEMYLGARHPRVRDERYDILIDAYVTACTKLFPHAMLHWEDFGATNARRILNKYADQVCTFNDDMQGTAAVVLAAVLSATHAAGSRLRNQRVVIYGSGTAGLGIADMMREEMIREGLSADEATRRFYPLGRKGLLIADDPKPPGLPAAVRPQPQRNRWLGAAPGRGHRACRRCRQRSPDDLDRHVHTRRRVHRGDRAGHGGARRPADHPAAVQPDGQGGGGARRPSPVDRRPRPHRHRQPLRPRSARRPHVPDRPGQQRTGVPRAGDSAWSWTKASRTARGRRGRRERRRALVRMRPHPAPHYFHR